jgi:hypothetical protein
MAPLLQIATYMSSPFLGLFNLGEAWGGGGTVLGLPLSISAIFLDVDGRFCSHLRFPVCPRVTLQTPQGNFVHQYPVVRQIASRSRTRCRDPPAVAWSFTRNTILYRHIETSPDLPSYSASNGARDGDNTAAFHLLFILFPYDSCFSHWWEASRG